MKINIRPYTRRGKKGTLTKVKGYIRRLSEKGSKSRRAEKSTKRGVEYAQKKHELSLSPEDIARRREVTADFNRAEAERKSLNMTREQYSNYKLKYGDVKPRLSLSRTEQKTSMSVVDRFIEKYRKKKHRR